MRNTRYSFVLRSVEAQLFEAIAEEIESQISRGDLGEVATAVIRERVQRFFLSKRITPVRDHRSIATLDEEEASRWRA